MFLSSAEFFSYQFNIEQALPALSDPNGNFLVEGGANNFTFTNGDQPEIIYRLLGGTPKLLVDLVEADTTFTPSITRRSILNPKRMIHHVKRAIPASPSIVGNLFEIDYNTRNVFDSTVNGVGFNDYTISATTEGFTFGNGSVVPNGSYRVLVRALKIFGDETKESDYESWLSPTIGVNGAASPSGNSTVPEIPSNTTITTNTTLPSSSVANTTSTSISASASASASAVVNVTSTFVGSSNSTSSTLP